MNLFFNTSISEFQNLIRNAIDDKAMHDVVIDNDGEILIDPHLQQPALDPDKFRIRFQVNGSITKGFESKPRLLKKLFRNMLNAWNSSINVVA